MTDQRYADPAETTPRGGISFGAALMLLKDGRRVSRLDWAGPNMPWLVLVPGSTFTIAADRPMGQAAPELVDKTISYQPHIDIVSGDAVACPWLPSTVDLLAEDWTTVS